MINLNEVLNEQELLFLCLSSRDSDDSFLNDLCDRVIVAHCVNLLGKEEFTEEDVAQKMNEVILDFVLESMVLKGDIEESIDNPGNFSITEQGRQVIREYRSE